ncbi:transcription termination/antitermination protein NusA [Alkalibacter rhizosphaerae]|uniref:Transcription termination/antitermination protein NusA n=1 Tax=Alkalibacter rhizosphaerae TaxID=2815577 RepID=A0A974XFD9_9FIRM|nr:transcription termination factor NusA [Alkalibacter rhizosphaerae]QSX08691.1 transcription termination/antitermination protein NusA [Alkalibacter rhizosphaerae]
MNKEFIMALDSVEKEKGIDKEELIDAIEAAIASAYKKNYGSAHNIKINIDRETGEIDVHALKDIVEDVEDPVTQIGLEDARQIHGEYEIGDVAEIEIKPKNFGRIAAQNAKQLVVQRIKEAERNIIFNQFIEREDEIINGVIQRKEKNNVFIDLGKTEGIMLPTEQVQGEEYEQNKRIKVYLLEVKKTTKGPQILVSRTHPGLVKRLFESEVPEIYDGTVVIKSISREAGSRTKIAVFALDANVDPVGSCVGPKGIRVQNIVDELHGEKIDIIKWSDDPKEYIASSLSPAKVLRVDINEMEKSALVVVDDYQLSLAIGKEGQNARLAAKLTGWKIDIKSKTQAENMAQVQTAAEELLDDLEL